MSKRIVFVYATKESDNIEAEYEVDAESDWQAIHMVEEHHPEIRTKDFDIMTKGIDI